MKSKPFNNQFATQNLRAETSTTTSGPGSANITPPGGSTDFYTTKKKTDQAKKKKKDVEPKLAVGEAENYARDHWGWKEARSIPNRSSDMFDYKELWQGEKLNEDEYNDYWTNKIVKIVKGPYAGNSQRGEVKGEVKGAGNGKLDVEITSHPTKLPFVTVSEDDVEVIGQLQENYSRFKRETKTRTNEQQLHAAMRLAEKKIREANRILEYTSQLRGELNETKANKNTQKLMEKIKKGITEAYGKMKKMGAVSAPTEKQDFFGMSKQDFDALIAASERNKYRPSPEKIAIVKSKFPNISDEEAAIALKLINSPAQDTFTRYDVMNYLQKYR